MCYHGHCAEVGLAEALCNTVLKADADYRHIFWSNMMVYGGSSLIQGLHDRLYMEVVMQSDPGNVRMRAAHLGARVGALHTGTNQ